MIFIGLSIRIEVFGQEVSESTSVKTITEDSYGENVWIGHVYDGINLKNKSKHHNNNYYQGYIESPMEFTTDFGGNETYFPVKALNNSYQYVKTDRFSVSYMMHSTKTGCYKVNISGDDGIRLSINETSVFDKWTYQSIAHYNNILINFDGDSRLKFDYFENHGANIVSFENLVKLNEITSDLVITQCPIANIKTLITANSLPEINSTIGYKSGWQFKEEGKKWHLVPGANKATTCSISSVYNNTKVQKVFYFRRRVVFTQQREWDTEIKRIVDKSAVVKVIVPVMITTNPIACVHKTEQKKV